MRIPATAPAAISASAAIAYISIMKHYLFCRPGPTARDYRGHPGSDVRAKRSNSCGSHPLACQACKWLERARPVALVLTTVAAVPPLWACLAPPETGGAHRRLLFFPGAQGPDQPCFSCVLLSAGHFLALS